MPIFEWWDTSEKNLNTPLDNLNTLWENKSMEIVICPECQQDNCEYLGCEETEIYECRDCENVFSYRNPGNT